MPNDLSMRVLRGLLVLGGLCALLAVSLPTPTPDLASQRSGGEAEMGASLAGMSVPEILEMYNVKGKLTCSTCKDAVKLLLDMSDSKMSYSTIAEVACEVLGLDGKVDKNVCHGVAQTFKVSLLQVCLI